MTLKNWYIVESGRRFCGPFSLEEIHESRCTMSKGTYLIRGCVDPIYARDEVGFQEIAELGYLLESPEGLTSILPTPYSKIRTSASDEFLSVATNDLSSSKNDTPIAPLKGKFTEFLNWISKIKSIKKTTSGTTLLALLCLFASTPTNNASSKYWLQNRLSAKTLTPTFSVMLNNAVVHKLSRNYSTYSQSIDALESLRLNSSDDQLPSASWTAAVQKVSILSDNNTYFPANSDPNSLTYLATDFLTKKSLNERAENFALAKIATESQRITDMFFVFGGKARIQGINSSTSPGNLFATLWNGKRGINRELAIPDEALSKASDCLKQIDAHFESIQDNEITFRNRLVSRALWANLQLLMLAQVKHNKFDIHEELLQIERVAHKLPKLDQTIIIKNIQEINTTLQQDLNIEIITQSRIKIIEQLQTEDRILCNLTQSAIAADFILQTEHISKLSFAKNSNHTMQPTIKLRDLSQNCLIGSETFIPLTSKSEQTKNNRVPARNILPVTAAIPMDFPSALAKNAFASHPIGAITPENLFSIESTETLWRYFAHIDTQVPATNVESIQKMCTVPSTLKNFCLNFNWHYSTTSNKKLKLLKTVAEVFPTQDTHAAAFTFAADSVFDAIKTTANTSAIFQTSSLQFLNFPKATLTLIEQALPYMAKDSNQFATVKWFLSNQIAITKQASWQTQ